jgi:hypothetical protein
MIVLANVGLLTTVLEMAAASIGAGVVVGGFVVGGAGMLKQRSRKQMEGNALRDVFFGGLVGMSCLCIDLLMRYALWP